MKHLVEKKSVASTSTFRFFFWNMKPKSHRLAKRCFYAALGFMCCWRERNSSTRHQDFRNLSFKFYNQLASKLMRSANVREPKLTSVLQHIRIKYQTCRWRDKLCIACRHSSVVKVDPGYSSRLFFSEKMRALGCSIEEIIFLFEQRKSEGSWPQRAMPPTIKIDQAPCDFFPSI